MNCIKQENAVARSVVGTFLADDDCRIWHKDIFGHDATQHSFGTQLRALFGNGPKQELHVIIQGSMLDGCEPVYLVALPCSSHIDYISMLDAHSAVWQVVPVKDDSSGQCVAKGRRDSTGGCRTRNGREYGKCMQAAELRREGAASSGKGIGREDIPEHVMEDGNVCSESDRHDVCDDSIEVSMDEASARKLEAFFAAALSSEEHFDGDLNYNVQSVHVTRCFLMVPRDADQLAYHANLRDLLSVWSPPHVKCSRDVITVCVIAHGNSSRGMAILPAALKELAEVTKVWATMRLFPAPLDIKPMAREAAAVKNLSACFSTILGPLKLATRDRHELEKRGLKRAEIEEIGFKTWPGGYMLVPHMLQREDAGGRKHILVKPALLIPARNVDGQVIALYTKPHDSVPDQYMWISRDRSFKLPFGSMRDGWEEPLFCVCFDQSSSQTVALVEGGLKAYVLAHLVKRMSTTKVHVIGSPGGHFYRSREGIISTLACLKAKKVILFPDAGAVENYNVLLSYFRTFHLLAVELGLQVDVAWYGQRHKSKYFDIDDLLNEVQGVDMTKMQMLSIFMFFQQAPRPVRKSCFQGRHGDTFRSVLETIESASWICDDVRCAQSADNEATQYSVFNEETIQL